MLLIGAMLSLIVAKISMDISRESLPKVFFVLFFIYAIPVVAWTLVVIRELALSLVSDTKPFVLVTPDVVMNSDYAHGCVEAYRLREATNFKSYGSYSGQEQKYQGTVFEFVFPEGAVKFMLKNAGEIESLNRIIEQARAKKGMDGGNEHALQVYPTTQGSTKRPATESFMRPAGAFWIGALGIGLILGLILLVAQDFIRRYLT